MEVIFLKDKITTLKNLLFIIMVIGFASGCNGNQNEFIQDNSTFGISQVHTSKPIDQSVANHAKEKIIAKEDITDVKAVNTDKELMAAIKVENFDRFRLKSIEKSVKSDLEKNIPTIKFLFRLIKKYSGNLKRSSKD